MKVAEKDGGKKNKKQEAAGKRKSLMQSGWGGEKLKKGN